MLVLRAAGVALLIFLHVGITTHLVQTEDDTLSPTSEKLSFGVSSSVRISGASPLFLAVLPALDLDLSALEFSLTS